MEALGVGVNLNVFSGQLQNSKDIGHNNQMDIIYICTYQLMKTCSHNLHIEI